MVTMVTWLQIALKPLIFLTFFVTMCSKPRRRKALSWLQNPQILPLTSQNGQSGGLSTASNCLIKPFTTP